MDNIWVTSDTHFGHTNIIKYCSRPFKDVTHMNEELILNWNNCVKEGDIVYHLGDFGFGSYQDLRKIRLRLNGNINFIRGNHDKAIQNSSDIFGFVKDFYEIKIEDLFVVMCHYPLLTWQKENRGAINLSGHTHNASWLVRPNRKGIHVGVDAWDFKPVSWEEIKAKAATIEVNLDYNNL
jgi:calcineurin-like phosphoesterase family protein